MTEGLFILTIIFVAYVVYVAVNEHKGTAKSQEPVAKPETLKATVQQPMPEVIAKKDKPATHQHRQSLIKPRLRLQLRILLRRACGIPIRERLQLLIVIIVLPNAG